MVDEDFVIRFRADTEAALRAMNELVAAATLAETKINTAISATSTAAGGRALARGAQAGAAAFASLGLDVEALEARLKALGPNFSNGFVRAVRQLPGTLGDIEIFKNAGQIVPEAKIRSAIRGLQAIQTVLADDTAAVQRFQTVINGLNTRRIRQQVEEIRRLQANAAEGAATKDRRLQINSLTDAERALKRLQDSGINVTKTLGNVRAELARLGQPIQTTPLDIFRANRRELESLRTAAQAARNLGDLSKEESALKRYRQRLEELGTQGVRTGLALQSTQQRLADIANIRFSNRSTEAAFRAEQRLQDRLRKLSETTASARLTGDTRGEIAGLRAQERQFARLVLQGRNFSTELATIQARLKQLGQDASLERIGKTLQNRLRSVEEQILNAQLGGREPSRQLLARGLGTAIKLDALGFQQGTVAIQRYQSALAKLGPVHSAEITALLKERDALLHTIRLREQVGRRPTGNQLSSGLDINRRLSVAAAGSPIGAAATVDMQRFSTAIAANRHRLDEWTSSFGGHARRIAEGLIIYNAFGQALGSVQQAFTLIANLDREMARFEAVAGALPETGAKEFIAGLGQVAIETNTPLLELISTTDLVAASFQGFGLAPEKITEAARQFQNLAGQFSNVTGQGQEEVTRNLVSLFRQMRQEGESSEESLSRFSGFLDVIVTAGHNASSVITEIVDALREAGPSARTSGANFGLLAFAIAEVTQKTGESGLSIGNTLKTILGNLAATSKVKDVFSDIDEGIVQLTDSDGSLLRSTDILLNLFAAVDQGRLSLGQAREIFRDLGPQIHPGQVGVVNDIFDAIGSGIKRMGIELPEARGALESLSDTIVDTLGGRFEQILRRLEVLIANGLLEPFVAAGEFIVGALEGIISVLSDPFGGAIIGAIAKIALLTGAGALLLRGFGAVRTLFTALSTTIRATFAGGLAAEAAALRGLSQAATEVTILGPTGQAVSTIGVNAATAAPKITLMSRAISLAGFALKAFLPLLLATVAVDLAMWALDARKELALMNEQLANTDEFAGTDLEVAVASRRQGPLLLADPNSHAGAVKHFQDTSTDIQDRNIDIFREQIKQLGDANNLTAEKFRALANVLLESDGTIKRAALSTDDFTNALSGVGGVLDANSFQTEEYLNLVEELTTETDELTAAEQRAAAALQTNLGLTDERARLISELTAQLSSGAITVDEFSQGQENIARASETASAFLAAYGDQLQLIPGLQERIAATGENAGEALLNILTSNPETISEQLAIIDRMIEIRETQEEVAEAVAQTPITPNIDNVPMDQGRRRTIENVRTVLQGVRGAQQFLDAVHLTPSMNLRPMQEQTRQFLTMIQTMIRAVPFVGQAMSRVFGRAAGLGKIGATLGKGGGDGNAQIDDLLAELEALGGALGELGGIVEGDARLGGESAREPQQTALLDIGDLPTEMLAQVIAMAQEAQNRIVGAGGTVDTDEIVALLKEGQFLQLVRGIDQRLLQQALQQLTEVEKKRLELEQQRLQDVTRNLVTQVGPIQSLISAPVLAAGGGALTGQGLNADPRMGNFTINVPINWSGMSLQQLQQFIYKTIAQAWVDAGRGG